jgi:hypothetical protein
MATGLVAHPMAKKKAPAKAPESGGEPRRNIISIRGTESWRAWLMGLAAHRRLKAPDVIDQALIEYAQKYGFTEPAPPR